MKTARSAFVMTAALLVASVVAWPFGQTAAAAADTTFSGQATVLKGQVAGITVGPLVDTGPVNSSGGELEASLLEYPGGGPDPTNGALAATVLHAAVHAHGNKSHAEATVADLAVNAAGVQIGATFLASRADATCNGNSASVSGSSEIVGLSVNGQSVVITGGVSQTVPLLGVGAIIINEQVGSASADHGDITVNALHIMLTDPALHTTTDLIVASAHADIACGNGGQCANQDFVTGGGWIKTTAGAKANFAVAAGTRAGWGHLQYIDHGGVRAKGTAVTMYVSTGPTSRHIEGNADINGAPGTYQVDVADNGEPGRDDTFLLKLSTGYMQGGTLGGGNIQLHCR
jgi:hypothetical protein